MTLCKLSALRFQYLEGDFIAGSWMWVIIFNRLIIVFRFHNCSKGLVLGDTFSCSGPGALATPSPPAQRKIERFLNQKLLKGCHQVQQNVTILTVLERLEFKNFSWPLILFSVPWPIHFEIHFVGPAARRKLCQKK